MSLKVVVMGSGGVGGYVGARLQDSGCDVSFVARGDHLRAMRDRGLTVFSPLGDVHLNVVRASDNPGDFEPADIVLFAVKLYDMAEAARSILPLIGPRTVVVPLLNGVDAPDVLAEILGRKAVAGGVIRISASLAEPGVIRHIGAFASIVVGSLDPAQVPVLEAFREALGGSGIGAEISGDIVSDLWRKMIFLAPFAAMTSLVRAPIGVIVRDDRLVAMHRQAIAEAVAVGRARGADLAVDAAEKVWTMTSKLPSDMVSSMQVDLERERRLELDWLSGALSRMGRELRIETPIHDWVATVLGPWRQGRPKP